MPLKLIIDADPGIGDALAIAVALLDPQVDLLAITATAGCVSGSQATHNIQVIVDSLDPPKLPRIGRSELDIPDLDIGVERGIANPIVMNGSTGLGNRELDAADLHSPHESAKLMVELVKNYPDEITLLTLGPLTNLDLAAEISSDFLGSLKELVCLGGALDSSGDVSAVAEFNIFANPEAAGHVLRSPATKTLVPLDIATKAVLTFDYFNRISDGVTTRFGCLLHELLQFALRIHHEHLGLEGFPLKELTALVSILRPRLFDRMTLPIDVELDGRLTRGMTVFDRRGFRRWQSNIDVLHDVDSQGVVDYLAQVISQSTS